MQLHTIEKWLTAVIYGAGAWSIRSGIRIDIEHRLAALIQMAVALIAYLVIYDRKFAEITTAWVSNYGGPATEQLLAGQGVKIL